MFFLNLSLPEFLAILGSVSGLVVALYLLDRTRKRHIVATLRFFAATENPPVILDGYEIGAKAPDGDWLIPDRVMFERADEGIGRPFDMEFRSRPELCPQRLPGMVLFGNSSSDMWWPLGFHRYFCFSRRARNPISRFKLFYDTMPAGTKYFIYQYHETWLTELLDDPWFSNSTPQAQ